MIRSLASAFALAFLVGSLPAMAQEAQEAGKEQDAWRTSTSLIGKSKYEGGFEHYDHVNPDAPKGGRLNAAANGTFDSFNPYIVQGTPAAGLNYQGGLLWDNLMSKAIDEPSASHPLIATDFRYPDDFSSATYRLDERARWHDGVPITAADVVWSFEQLKAHSPQYTQYFQNVVSATADNERQVTFTFDQKDNRELPLIMSDLPVLPKHWWTEEGKERDFTKSSLEIPLGSGPYRISAFRPGQVVTWTRVEDYWAADLPVNKGRYNFDVRTYRYFKDPNAIWQAFTKGGLEDIRAENRAQRWAEGYTFPAFEDGAVIKEEFPEASGYGMTGWMMNTRRAKFSDPRVRRALLLAYNFEDMNKDQFFGQYTRTASYFGGSELQATGVPQGRELEILEEFRDQLPADLFTKPYELPVYESRRDERKFLREAFELLKQAGFERQGTELIDPTTGEQMTLEVLGYSPESEKTNAPWLNALRKLGIDATFRIVDTSQYIARLNSFDFDVFAPGNGLIRQSQSPGNEQREYWTSAAAEKEGSRNFAGIRSPVVDALVDKLIFATSREELVAYTNALDRVLLWNDFIVPGWHLRTTRVARWDKFGIPRPQPAYTGIDPESWWIDPEKAAALAEKY